ncbi:MAG: YbaB/EbfC family nucleoid-associated protein [Catenulispora sp.]|nr:YbaB/EbfC family nucleoid-associated protein [Catenulispora sp.]
MNGLPPGLRDFDMHAFADRVRRNVVGQLDRRFTGSSDEGRVTATVTALGVLESIDVDILSKRRLDNHSLGEAIATAVRAAEAEAEQAKAAMMDDLLGSLGLPIPRFDAGG